MNSTSISCKLLCASASAYYVGLDGQFLTPTTADPNYNEYANVGFIKDPTAYTNKGTLKEDKINAAILGQTQFGYVLAFRGTLPPNNWDPATLEDWWQDICDSGEVKDKIMPGNVHKGFHKAFHSIWSQIYADLNQIYNIDNCKAPLYITGHSKGGPMATYGAYYAHHNKFPIGQVITIASPYPGDATFAKAYNKVINQVRYENHLDIVPWLPPDDKVLGKIIPAVDCFIDALKLFGFKNELTKFEKFVNKSLKLNYTAVGSLKYVTKSGDVVDGAGLTDLRIAQLIYLLVNSAFSGKSGVLDAFKQIGDAHKIGMGGGYETGVCKLSTNLQRPKRLLL